MRRVIMRIAPLLLLAFTACHTELPTTDDPAPASVRERLETEETRLFVADAASTGTIMAHRRVAGAGWQSGLVDLRIETGEVVATADASGAITLERFSINIAPIDIPREVFDRDAQITNVRVELVEPVTMTAAWTSDDEAHATASLDLRLRWAITLDGSTLSLGEPELPPVGIELALGGDGELVHAELRAHAPGEVWGWAGIIRFEDLSLDLGAATP